jgi:homoserine dehydrogenase
LPTGLVKARVAPVALAEHDPLARVPGAFNEIVVEGDAFRSLTLRGPGAGGPETATAVLGDILAIASTAIVIGAVPQSLCLHAFVGLGLRAAANAKRGDLGG